MSLKSHYGLGYSTFEIFVFQKGPPSPSFSNFRTGVTRRRPKPFPPPGHSSLRPPEIPEIFDGNRLMTVPLSPKLGYRRSLTYLKPVHGLI